MDIGVDLGTATVLVFIKGKGIVLNEPAVVAVNLETQELVAFGAEAREMIGRTPGNIVAVRPLREGVIADFEVTKRMLQHFIRKACGRQMFRRPRVMICHPAGVTSVEKRAVEEAAYQAGARAGNVFLIEEPVAAALGAGIDIAKPGGSFVVDIGGGTTDVAIMSLGGIVISDAVRVGGDKFDEALIRYIKEEHKLLIGERTAEDLKIKVGTAYPGGRNESMEVRGRDMVTGLPKTIEVTSLHCLDAFEEPLSAIVALIRRVLEQCPPELAADIVDKGIVLTGGGALLNGMDRLLSEVTQVPVAVADDPITAVARGAGRALDSLDVLRSAVTVGAGNRR
jgi:rod shape-determining protein MreB